jgi:RNA polymerase sigma-70 factor (ECF subfamily)
LRPQDVIGPHRPFEELVREHEGMLYRKALQLCGSPSDARDLVQETFERGLRSYDRYKPQGSGVSWLMTILRNLVIDRCRSRVREPRVLDSPEELEAQLPAPEPEAGPSWSAITPDQVREALGKLNEDFRVAYELHAFEGLSYEQIAQRVGVPRNTVGTRVMRARRRLKELLVAPKTEEDAV